MFEHADIAAAMSTQIRATPYPTLFSPIRIGSLTLRNRIVNLPQGMGYTNSGLVVDEDIAYHRRRALGGVGLIVTGGTATDPTSTDRTRNFVEIYDGPSEVHRWSIARRALRRLESGQLPGDWL